MTLIQELEFGRLMQTPMKDFPTELKDALHGKIACIIRETVRDYVVKMY